MGGTKKATVSIDGFTEAAQRIIEDIPEKFCKNLNGGFNIVEEGKKDGEYFVMGEYIQDEIMGAVVMIYYGSFVELLGESDYEVWEAELKETILHELRHHVELMAGVDYLSEEERMIGD